MNSTRIALLAILIALFAGDTASAAPVWLTSQPISGPNSSNAAPDIAVNARGDAAATWLRKSGGTYLVQETTRPAGGSWRAPDTLPSGPVNGVPRVGLDGAGNADVVWAASGIGNNYVWQSHSTGGVFAAAGQLDSGTTQSAPALAVNERGDAVAAWTGAAGGLFAAVRPAGAGWSAAKQVSAKAFAERPDVAIDQEGRAVVTWTVQSSIEAAFYIPGPGWGKADTVASGDQNFGGDSPQAAIDASGRATVVWRWFGLALPVPLIKVAEGSATAGWNQAVALQAKGLGSSQPDVAVAAGGKAVATWTRNDNGHTVIEAALRAGPDSAWGDPALVSDATKDSVTPNAAIDAHGNALVAWDQQAAVGHLPYAAEWRAGGAAWSPQHALAAPASSATTPRIAFDSGGDAIAAFAHGTPVHTADYDAGPVLSDVATPAAGSPGEALAFSASATDRWSPVTIGWDFGDGATATGTPVSHAYAGPGDYTVKVTARDAAGAETSATRMVHVPAPVVPPSTQSTSPAPHVFAGLTLKSQRVTIKKRLGRVTAACPADTAGACKGTLRLLAGKRVVARAKFSVAPGRGARIRVRLRRAPRSVRASAAAHDGLGASRTTSAKLKLVRK